ncbi:MAG: thiamine pyrophosphate-dependent enzyme [Xanthomonadales bacterium]|nr:thiamine pyrophosphate-dependent enzyme [Xanthomonadales bacterium]
MSSLASQHIQHGDRPGYDWHRVAYLLLLSRAIDEIEESKLVPAKKVFNQFSARGHDFAQILLGSCLSHPHDGVSGYYRSRPLALTLGLSAEDALASPLARSGGYSDGRDIGVVCNLPGNGKMGPTATLLPMSGGVGAQYTPAVGWAHAAHYRASVLNDANWKGAIGVATGGDASASTNGFWAALNIVTVRQLPFLFYIEDNGYGISVPAKYQTPGGDHVANLASWQGLAIFDGDGTDPATAPGLVQSAVNHVREGQGPALLRLKVPRLCGHTFQDTQAYKPQELIDREKTRDPLPLLKRHLIERQALSETEWHDLEQTVTAEVAAAADRAEARPQPDPARLKRYVFAETLEDGSPDPSLMGGLRPEGYTHPEGNERPNPQGQRVNMLTAIRRTLDYELEINPRVLVFGEDVGLKGGVHAATLGLMERHGRDRVFDTSLSEEGIIGRSVGMAVAGLMPVPEIQFRKYAEPAAEQITDAGITRWRTVNKFACPMVVRIPGGFAQRGDPWHSMCNEVEWAHKIGWQVAMPSNAEDAVGLLRTALRDDNPTMFFEHRTQYDAAWARRPYPGDDYVVPFGKARRVVEGKSLTVVTWGAMVERCEAAARDRTGQVEVLDLRTIVPWDKEAVCESVRRTGRCLIVHEDTLTAGFGAEIAAILADELFWDLDAPVRRLTMPDIPNPHNIELLTAAVPTVDKISDAMGELLAV